VVARFGNEGIRVVTGFGNAEVPVVTGFGNDEIRVLPDFMVGGTGSLSGGWSKRPA
jgi:hypothetical protein